MSARLRVVLLGFSASERAELESYLMLNTLDKPSYVVVGDLAAADLAIVDADDAYAMHEMIQHGRYDDGIFVGSPEALRMAPAAARLRVLRPLAARQVAAELDALAQVLEARERQYRQGGADDSRKRKRLSARTRIAAMQRHVQDFHQSTGFSNSVLAREDRRFDNVLVVDDSQVARDILAQRLERLGFTVVRTASGEAALPLLAESPFEFVFVDVSMAGMDGFELCRHLRRKTLPGYRRPVVVMVTSRTSTLDRIRGTLAGCDAFLAKPVDDRELIRLLARHDDSFERTFEDTVPPQELTPPPPQQRT